MKKILLPHLNKEVGINCHRPFHIDGATLTEVEDDYFAVRAAQDQSVHYYPYTSVLQVISKSSGVVVGGLFTHKQTFPLVIKVGHLVDFAPTA